MFNILDDKVEMYSFCEDYEYIAMGKENTIKSLQGKIEYMKKQYIFSVDFSYNIKFNLQMWSIWRLIGKIDSVMVDLAIHR